MSRLYFHSEHDGTAELLGAERAHIGRIVRDVAVAMLPSAALATHHMTSKGCDRIGMYADRDMKLWFGAGEGAMFEYQGQPVDDYPLALNTVLVLGNDVLQFFARLDGQCEHHAYVEGPHRAWLAGIIETGLKRGICRSQIYAHEPDGSRRDPRSSGWEDVVALLLKRDDAPIVTSYSVCEWFPNADICDIWDEDAAELWESQTAEEQWAQALDSLRKKNKTWQLELRPDTLHLPFRHTVSLFDIFNE
jgi:hypothetical protein